MSSISKCKFAKKLLCDISSTITDGDHNAPDYKNSGILYLLSESIQTGYIDESIYRYIAPNIHKKLNKSALCAGDVLVTKTGVYFGKSAVVPTGFPEANTSAHVGIIRLSDNSINPYYLSTFINSKYGYYQFRRRGIKATRPEIKLIEFDDIKIVELPTKLQLEVERIVKNAIKVRKKSKDLYSEAEAYLLECLGMKDFVANSNAYNTLSFKDSFLETGRFDAEYYLPKYEDYCKLIQSYSNGYELLKTACDIQDINYTPEDGRLYKYVELADIGKSGEITGCDINKGENLPTRARRMIHTNDVIVSSIEGSLDSCALVTDDYDGALCSTGFHVLQSSKLNPETLLTLFKSLPIQQLMKKGCSGTILTAINKPELEKLPIPIIRTEIQQEIAKHIRQSYALRKEALQLLENAKLTVEQIIESGGGNYVIINKLQNGAIREFRTAIWLLLIEIGVIVENNADNNIITTTKKMSDSFLCSGRFDAEYYQPKYDYLFNRLSDYETLALGDLADIHKSIEPGSDAYCDSGIPFIRVSDLSKFGLSKTSIYLDKMNYADVIRPIKDAILLSKDGSVGIAYKTEEDLDIITSGAILHLKIKNSKVLPDYLTLVLNSIIVQLQAERDAGGSIIQHWKPSEIEKVQIPILPLDIQANISKKIQYSFLLRKESLQLLEQAKLLVEHSIETGN
ncbi:MAG: restriction endonuclease subunit S [Bacteroidales bacterium]|nr:restriction endonuclease subunit S [Bacteroidales bacterium]